MSINPPPGDVDDPNLPDPAPDPEPDPQPGGPVPERGEPQPQLEAPGLEGPPLRMPRDNPDVETEI